MLNYIKGSDSLSKKYDVEKATDGFFDITISLINKKHRATLFFGGNIGQGFKDFDTRAEAKIWVENLLVKKKMELAQVIKASSQWDEGLHWIKETNNGNYELVQFRKHCGIIQVFHMGWDCSSDLSCFNISSIKKAEIIDPDGKNYF
jgi:hypothetical protein